jgi:hypothetical protein
VHDPALGDPHTHHHHVVRRGSDHTPDIGLGPGGRP